MGDDLVKRLREYAQVAHMAAAWGFAGEGYTMEKAADRIEELEAEVERLREIIDEAVNCPEPDHHCPAFRHVIMCVLASAIVEQEKSDD